MAIKWYICPYDPSGSWNNGTLIVRGREPAMYRIAPTYPDPKGTTWEEWPIQGNLMIVRVDAIDSVHDEIAAYADFYEVPTTLSAKDPTLYSVLQAVNYSSAELDGTGWNFKTLLLHIASKTSKFTVNDTKTGIVVTSDGHLPHKSLTKLDAILSGDI